MFGMSFTEILVIAVVAVLFLGPDKLPEAMVQIAKFFRSFKSSLNDAKQSIEQEIKIYEIKEEANKIKSKINSTTQDVRKKLTFDELDDLKKAKQDINDNISSLKDELSLKNELASIDEMPKNNEQENVNSIKSEKNV